MGPYGLVFVQIKIWWLNLIAPQWIEELSLIPVDCLFSNLGQDLHLHSLHALWGVWEDHHGRWSHYVFREVLPRHHTINRSVSDFPSPPLSVFLCFGLYPSICPSTQPDKSSSKYFHLSAPATSTACEVWNYSLTVTRLLIRAEPRAAGDGEIRGV